MHRFICENNKARNFYTIVPTIIEILTKTLAVSYVSGSVMHVNGSLFGHLSDITSNLKKKVGNDAETLRLKIKLMFSYVHVYIMYMYP